MANFQNIDRDTPYLLPPSVQDWLPKNHLARFIVDIVDQLDLSPFYNSYSGRGNKAVDPRMLLTLLYYGYSTGIFSSRKLEKATYENIPVRFICGNTHPDHDTIANFRKRFLPLIGKYFVEILKFAQELGFKKVGNISVDGSKIKANASKHSAMSYGHIIKIEKLLKEEVDQLFELAKKADITESIELDIPKEIELREDRLKKISQAKKVIEERAVLRDEINKVEYEEKLKQRQLKEKKTGKKSIGKKPNPPKTGPRDKDQYNFTDPESAIMKSGSTGAFEQDYNAQLAVDQETYLVVGLGLSNHPNDKKELTSTLDSIPEEIGKPDAVAADTGYFSANNIEECEARNIKPFISTGRQPHHYTIEQLLEKEISIEDINIEGLSASEAMNLKLKTKEGKEIFRKRKCTVEPVFGIIKQAMGFRQFFLRGLEDVTGEWNLLCSAYNLKRMFNMSMPQTQSYSY